MLEAPVQRGPPGRRSLTVNEQDAHIPEKNPASATPLLRQLPQCCAKRPSFKKMSSNRVKKVTLGFC